MSGPWHPDGRARVSQTSPQALGICDRCGFQYNLCDLQWQYQWNGIQLQNLHILVCDICCDVPQEQLRAIILPPDPLPVLNPRPEPYSSEVPSYFAVQVNDVQTGQVLSTSDEAAAIVSDIEDTPTPDPNMPVIYPSS